MRLFVAIELPEDVRRGLSEWRRRRDWFGFGEGFREVPPQNRHVTLKFLGEVAEAKVEQVTGALRRVDWPPALMLRVEGPSFFPPRGKINVFVALLGGDVERLRELHRQVESALEPLGFVRDDRPYTPHVTLARAERSRGFNEAKGIVRQLVAKNPPAPGEPFTVNSVVLFQSHLKPDGPEYVPLARFGD
jgi:2'-5' RNA ligase